MAVASSTSPATSFAGFDTFSLQRSDFDDVFPSLLENYVNIKWCGFYLGRTGATFNFTRDKHDKLVGWGYNIAPIYFGKQLWQVPNTLADPFTLGKREGTNAVQQAFAVGIRAGSYIYFDVEAGMPSEGWLKHYAAWSQAVVEGQCYPGAYIRWEIVDWLYAGLAKLQNSQGYKPLVAAPRIWVVNYATKDPTRPPNVTTPPKRPKRNTNPADWIGPDPSVGHSVADMYQWDPGQAFHWTDSKRGKDFDLFPVDLSTSTDQDPGFPGP